MINQSHQYWNLDPRKKILSILLFVVAFFIPHLGLDYTLLKTDLSLISIPYGQYLFYFLTIIIVIALHKLSGLRISDYLYFGFSEKLGLCLLVIGICLSFGSLWNFRLAIIVFTISFMATALAKIIDCEDPKLQFKLVFVLFVPCIVPLLGSLYLEYVGPIKLGLWVENIKHTEEFPFRWRFLNQSANGYGLDAAIIATASYCYVVSAKNYLSKALFLALFLIGVFCLLMSGTRSAIIFAITTCVAFNVFYFGLRGLFLSVIVGVLSIFVLLTFVDMKFLVDFLRLTGDLEQLSSSRWGGIKGLLSIFLESPLSGLGFGGADKNIQVSPTNIFYAAIFAEIGLIGALGVLIILFSPVIFVSYQIFCGWALKDKIEKKLLSVAISMVIGFFPYLFFEFNILRVSATNQLFFFLWALVICKSLKLEKTTGSL